MKMRQEINSVGDTCTQMVGSYGTLASRHKLKKITVEDGGLRGTIQDDTSVVEKNNDKKFVHILFDSAIQCT